ncbi:MAG TPA: glycoside hydrolase family 88 protein, partial [Anaeromyxobacter sp.]|nr:glycoside hydrolase family 88 protein [Anaeromyxobacter sp.]
RRVIGTEAAIPWEELRGRVLLGSGPPPDPAGSGRCARVRRAMLAMQRASWEQGLASQAALEEGEAELALLLAREAVLRQDPTGRLAQLGADPGVTDAAAAGEAVVFAALTTGEHGLVQGVERLLGYLLERAPRNADGILFHQEPRPQGELWSDSFYMAPPFLALAGQPGEAMRQLRGLWASLWLPGRRLLAHRWNAVSGRFVREAPWGVGNGWAAAGMARTIRYLPRFMVEERDELAVRIRDVLEGCLGHRREDGLFHDVVDDPSTFVETNLAQMLAWTIYRGLADGWLEPAWRGQAEELRRAVLPQVDASGLVQGVCGSPGFDRPGTATEGQAFFLMMEAARGVAFP